MQFVSSSAPSFSKWCPSGQEMRCDQASSNNECVRREFFCDGHRNCPSGEDETNCGAPVPTATTRIYTNITPKTTISLTTINAKTTSTTSTPKTTTNLKSTPTPTLS